MPGVVEKQGACEADIGVRGGRSGGSGFYFQLESCWGVVNTEMTWCDGVTWVFEGLFRLLDENTLGSRREAAGLVGGHAHSQASDGAVARGSAME